MIFAISSGLTYTLGRMTGSPRHGWAVWAAMAVLFLMGVTTTYWAEAKGNPILAGVDQQASALQSGGNMEGKEVRFGIANSALFATATTDTSCGAVNSQHDSFTPLGGMVPLINIMLGEVVFGGVGSGLYGMVVFVILAVFIAGLMVGRTPEYLGKKIESYDVKMAMLSILMMTFVILGFSAVAIVQAIWHCEHFESGTTWTFAGFVSLHFVGRKQWVGVWRAERKYAVVQHQRRGCHAAGPILHGHSGSRYRREPGQEKDCSRFRRDVSGDRRAVHGLARFHDSDCECANVFSGAKPGPDSRALADALRKGFLRPP